GEGDGVVCLWDLATGKRVRTLPGNSMAVASLEFSRDGGRLLSATSVRFASSGRLDRGMREADPKALADPRIWDLETDKEVLPLDLKGLMSAALSPDGAVIAATFADGTAHLYEVATGKETLVLKSAGQGGIAFSHDGKRLVTTDTPAGLRATGRLGTSSVKLWDAKTGEEILTLDDPGSVPQGPRSRPGVPRGQQPDRRDEEKKP